MIWEKVKDFTMTDILRINKLVDIIEQLSKNNMVASFVECGVWKGGSAMAAAYAYLDCEKKYGIILPHLYLYDTYEGMTSPKDCDIKIFTGKHSLKKGDNKISIDEVIHNMEITNYPKEKIHYIKGDVKETLKKFVPENIGILRLDTDFYDSTKFELEMLYDNVISNGYVIIDDYLHWKGSQLAVNEYINENNLDIKIIKINERDAIYWKK